MTIYELWDNVDESSFYLELNGKKIKKNELESKIKFLKDNLSGIAEWENRKVYIDIKDRLNFIVVLIALLRFKARVVLVPIEAKIDDFFHKGCLYLSDSKNDGRGIFIKPDLLIIEGDSFDPAIIEEPENNDIALYLYTSGSTGRANLIPKTSLNLLSEVMELKNNLGITKDDIFYFTPPMYHIYGILFDLLLPLYSSARIILDYYFTPESIAEFVAKKKVTHFVSIPSYYRMFAELGLTGNFKKCKGLYSSSAPLPLDISQKFYEKQISIIEIYGSTETGGVAYRTSAESPDWKLFSYVKIIEDWPDYDGTKAREEVEFKINSPAISVSYDKIRGFNTGDIVNLYPKGKFRLLGRNTRFVKISGKRVDLNFVLEKIFEYLKTNSAYNIKEEQLYISEKNEKIFCIFELKFPKPSKNMKDDLKKILPGYSIPRLFISAAIPRNSMGKINKVKIEEMISSKIS